MFLTNETVDTLVCDGGFILGPGYRLNSDTTYSEYHMDAENECEGYEYSLSAASR
jgi:hypothetical protein